MMCVEDGVQTVYRSSTHLINFACISHPEVLLSGIEVNWINGTWTRAQSNHKMYIACEKIIHELSTTMKTEAYIHNYAFNT